FLRRPLRISQGAGSEFNRPDATGNYECYWWLRWSAAADCHSFPCIRAPGAFPDSFRHAAVHGAGDNHSLAAVAAVSRRAERFLVARRDSFSVLFINLWRILWRRQQHSDIGRAGPAWSS